MAEPITTTSAAGGVGLLALLAGWVGPVGADVILVIFAALAGSLLAMSGTKGEDTSKVRMFLTNIALSLVLSWALVSMIAKSLGFDVDATIVAFMLSYGSKYLPTVLDGLIGKLVKKTKD